MSVPPSPGNWGHDPRAQGHQLGAPNSLPQPSPGGDGWWNLFESAAAPPPRRRPPKWPYVVAGATVVIAALCAVTVSSIVGSRDPSASRETSMATSTTTATSTPTSMVAAPRLLNLLPAGVPRGRCRAAEPSAKLRATIACEGSGAPGDPAATTWSDARSRAELDEAFQRLVAESNAVVCPGNIQSPVLCPTGVSKTVWGISSARMGATVAR